MSCDIWWLSELSMSDFDDPVLSSNDNSSFAKLPDNESAAPAKAPIQESSLNRGSLNLDDFERVETADQIPHGEPFDLEEKSPSVSSSGAMDFDVINDDLLSDSHQPKKSDPIMEKSADLKYTDILADIDDVPPPETTLSPDPVHFSDTSPRDLSPIMKEPTYPLKESSPSSRELSPLPKDPTPPPPRFSPSPPDSREPTPPPMREPSIHHREPTPPPIREPSPVYHREPTPPPARDPSPPRPREPTPPPVREPSPPRPREPTPPPAREPSPPRPREPTPPPVREPSPICKEPTPLPPVRDPTPPPPKREPSPPPPPKLIPITKSEPKKDVSKHPSQVKDYPDSFAKILATFKPSKLASSF